MKSLLNILGRIGLILAAALLVVGITSLINPATIAVGSESQRSGMNPQLPAGVPRSQGGAGMGMGRGRGEEAGGGHSHVSAVANLAETSELSSSTAQIALIMLPFAAWSIISRRRRLPALSRRERAAR